MDTDKLANYLFFISLAMLVLGIYFVFGLANFDRVVYDVFFYHVSSAWLSYLCFSVTFASSIAFLRNESRKWYYYAKNCAFIGIAFASVTVILGSLWFNATSAGYAGIYWDWDPRQTATLVLILSYAAYLVFANLIDDSGKQAKLTAIFGIVIFPSVPFSYLAAILFPSLHPLITANPGQAGIIYFDTANILILLYTLIAITLFFVATLRKFVVINAKTEELNQLIQIKLRGE